MMLVLLKNTVILSFFLVFPVFSMEPCGIVGSLEERIENCQSLNMNTDAFDLVTLNEDGHKFWYHKKKKEVWTPLYTMEKPKPSRTEMNKACPKPYRVPSSYELKAAYEDGLGKLDHGDKKVHTKIFEISLFKNTEQYANYYYSVTEKKEKPIDWKKDKNIKIRCVGNLADYVLLSQPI